MAVVSTGSNFALNMDTANVWYGQVVIATPNYLELSDGFHIGTYYGVGLTYNATSVTGGILTGYTELDGGILDYSVTGLSMSAPFAYQLIQQNQLPTLFSTALAGDDTIYGSNQNDLIRGFGGNDHIYGNGGDDILIGGPGLNVLDGGTGIDTAVYAGTSDQYFVLKTDSGFTVAGGDEGDQLISIEHLQFFDKLVDLTGPQASGQSLYEVQTANAGILRHYISFLDANPIGLALDNHTQNLANYTEAVVILAPLMGHPKAQAAVALPASRPPRAPASRSARCAPHRSHHRQVLSSANFLGSGQRSRDPQRLTSGDHQG
jgi:Ca2+-binding RTX toxin-like protein